MGFLAGLEHFASLYGISFAGGVAGGMLLAALLRLRWLRRIGMLSLAIVLLLISLDASFAFDLVGGIKALGPEIWRRPAVAWGVLAGAGMGWFWIVSRRRNTQTGVARPSGLPRAVLLVAILCLVALKIMLPSLADGIANSPAWGLPDQNLTLATLRHCQIEHSVGPGGTDTLLCPQAVPASGFSDWLRRTVIASEDRSFFLHGAVDFHGAVRAGRDLLSGTREGASTITQQLARILFLDRDQPFRKAFEAAMAQRIFDVARQDEILNAYLNVAVLPRNIRGFDEAARYYFGVSGKDLNLAESALLVGMLPRPAARDISTSKEPAKAASRRREALAAATRIIDAMVSEGSATPAQAKSAVAELTRRLGHSALRRGSLQPLAVEFRPYRDMAVATARASHVPLGDNYRLLIDMDPALQAGVVKATALMAAGHQGAGIVMQPDGAVLAVSGAGTYAGTFNRAVEITRSVGSTAKLLPLIAATEGGTTLNSTLPAQPSTQNGWPREDDPACSVSKMPLATALAHSCNRPFVRLTAKYSARVRALAESFGFDVPSDLLTLPVGGLETCPAQLAAAYATLPNLGVKPVPQYLIAAFGPNGGVLPSSPAAAQSPCVKQSANTDATGDPTSVAPADDGAETPAPMSPATAARVLADLRIPVKSGTATAANSSYVTVYGKTGTSNDSKDSVFAGIVQGGFVGVFWLGDDQPTAIAGAHGGGAPAAAFRQVVDGYYGKGTPAAAPADPWFSWQQIWRLVIEYTAALGLCALIANWLVQAFARRQVTPAPGDLPPVGRAPSAEEGDASPPDAGRQG